MNILSFPDYDVAEDGTVTRLSTAHVLKPQLRDKYLRVRLHRRWRPVHLLVLEAFVGPRPSPLHHGAHKDGNSRNNHLSNLCWKLPPENELDKRSHGTAPKGGAMVALKPPRVRAIRRRVERGQSYTKVAQHFGIHRHSVSRIARGLRHGNLAVRQ